MTSEENAHTVPLAAIIDFGLGNLFSVKHACEFVGLRALISHDRGDLLRADAVILPGVGAFGVAMENLRRLDLVSILQDIAASGKPFMGICLGMQLLMDESLEFGRHKGLGIFHGSVVPFNHPSENGRDLKIPHVGWNSILQPSPSSGSPQIYWDSTMLGNISPGQNMYFVHSFLVQPEQNLVLSTTTYGDVSFCSSIQHHNVFACQFHPERSGHAGLKIYSKLKCLLARETI
jgi:imidazole glycerol-phosphate synthase subunit HisH